MHCSYIRIKKIEFVYFYFAVINLWFVLLKFFRAIFAMKLIFTIGNIFFQYSNCTYLFFAYKWKPYSRWVVSVHFVLKVLDKIVSIQRKFLNHTGISFEFLIKSFDLILLYLKFNIYPQKSLSLGYIVTD